MTFISFSKKITTVVFLLILSCLAIFGQQYKGVPVTKERLLTALRTKALQTRQIVQTISNNGVDFETTPNVESELVTAGARPEVLTAVRNNYRAAAKPAAVSGNTGEKPPLTKAELLRTIRTKASSNGTILDSVETRGVSFETTAAVEREFVAAGASPAIIAAVKSSYGGPVSGSSAGSSPVASSAGKTKTTTISYDDLISQAIESYNRDVNSNLPPNSPGRLDAIQNLNKAITMDSNNPIGYQQLGFMTLYGTLNGFTAAENNFKKALELGGSAVFRVFHDHDGFFKETCQGSLYVSKDGVRFESDDNKHTFDTTDANIKQVKTNSGFRRAFQIKSGSFKIVLNDQSDKEGRKFSFAPLTDNIEESKLVIRLIGK